MVETLDSTAPALHIARVPGEQGPVVRCYGELTVATAEALRRELNLLSTLRHRALTVDVSGCRSIDADGILLLLETSKQLRQKGLRFALVAGTDRVLRMMQMLELDSFLPVFPTQASAQFALRGGAAPEAAPATWTEARAGSLATWRAILETLDTGPAEELMRRITSIHGLCRKAETSHQECETWDPTRCGLCPLFWALGGHSGDIGCQSLTQPLLTDLLLGKRKAARQRVGHLIGLLETMPIPED